MVTPLRRAPASRAHANVTIPHGISSMHVSIPANTTATVYVPATADESFVPVGGDVTPTGRVPGYQVFSAQPGDVTFHQGG